MVTAAVKSVFLVGCAVAVFVAAVLQCGHMARLSIRDRKPVVLKFSDADCPAPYGLTRDDFLSEVRYIADVPNELDALDDQALEPVAAAFARHPSVAAVESVRVMANGRLKLRLRFW